MWTGRGGTGLRMAPGEGGRRGDGGEGRGCIEDCQDCLKQGCSWVGGVKDEEGRELGLA